MVALHLVDVVCVAPRKRKMNTQGRIAILSGTRTYLSVRIGFVVFSWNTCITLSPPQVTNLESSIHATSKQLATVMISVSLLFSNGRRSLTIIGGILLLQRFGGNIP